MITAVDNVSFYIKPAEIFTLAGESGCGKTTTAKIVLGFEEATSGTIIHNGKRQTRNEKVWITEGVQAIFQDPFQHLQPAAHGGSAISLRRSRTYKLAEQTKEAH